MDIVSCANKIINRFGCTAKIENNGNVKTVKAFFQPIRYVYRDYSYGKRLPAGLKKNNSYIFITNADAVLDADNTVIHLKNRKYIVKRNEIHYFNDSPVYAWAVLSPWGMALEDDYE